MKTPRDEAVDAFIAAIKALIPFPVPIPRAQIEVVVDKIIAAAKAKS